MKDTVSGTYRARRRLWPVVLVISIVFLIAAWMARGPMLRESARLWIVSDAIEPADAIAVLGGGVDLRPFVAAQLYKRGLASQILVANVRPNAMVRLGLLRPHADVTRELLVQLGVPDGAIVGFGKEVASTFDEARALAIWAKSSGARAVIVPTEIFSSRRQRWILDRELAPVGARVMLDVITPPDYSADDWWRHEEGLIDFQNEVIKYAYYRLSY